MHLPLDEDFSYGTLRALGAADVPRMLEWMHAPETSCFFQFDFSSMDAEDALNIIEQSHTSKDEIHLAIMDPNENYLGTISLKNIVEGFSAEYAISMHSCAQGTGVAGIGTRDLLRFAFEVLGLRRIYLNVRADNPRAIRFYEKMHFIYEGTARQALRTKDGYVDLIWFAILESDWKKIERQ